MYRLMGIVMDHPILDFALPKIMDEDRLNAIELLVKSIADPTLDTRDRDIADWIVYAAKAALDGDSKPALELLELYRDIYTRDKLAKARAKLLVMEENLNYIANREADKTNAFVPDLTNF